MDKTLKGALCFKGERGYSAYEIAVKNGFLGTEEAWLASLGDETLYKLIPTNVKIFGAKGDGVTDDTKALQEAINNSNAIYIPSGVYKISDELILKSNIKIYGDGESSIIRMSYDYTDSIKYCFRYDNQDVGLYRTLIEDIHIESDNVNRLTGGIYVDFAMRGNSIENVWFNNISNPIYLGEKIWGIYSLKNIYSYFFPDSMSEENKLLSCGIYGGSNTIYGDNIEICGAYNYGVHLKNATVSSFINTNISGSKDIYMKTAYCLENCSEISIDNAWIEQCVDENGSVNTKTINVINSNRIKISNIHLASGSCFIDNCKDVDLTNIKYFTNTSGLRFLNNSYISSDKISVGYCNFQSNQDYSAGQVHIKNFENKSSVNLLNNPLFFRGIQEILGASNGNVTKSENTTDFYSGDRSFTIKAPNYQGGLIDTSDILVKNKTYTIIAIVKAVSNVDKIYLTTTNMQVLTDFPTSFYKNQGENDFQVIKGTYRIMQESSSFKIAVINEDGTNNAEFIIDSVFICEGKHGFEIPSGISKKSLLGTEKVKATDSPWDGTWNKGDIIYNNFKNSSNNNVHMWVYNGSSWAAKNL